MRIYLYDGFPLLLPVNPEEVMISSDSNSTVSEVINLGQVTELTTPELATFSFSSFWPDHWEYPYIQDKYSYYAREEFMKRMTDAREEKRPIRFMATEVDINMEVVIESFEWGYKGASEDIEYSMSFREYRKAQAKFLQQIDQSIYAQQPARPEPASGGALTVGAKVIVNGQLHRDSGGNGPGQTESNATRKISHIAQGKSHPIHVTTLEGGYRGWVTESSVKLA